MNIADSFFLNILKNCLIIFFCWFDESRQWFRKQFNSFVWIFIYVIHDMKFNFKLIPQGNLNQKNRFFYYMLIIDFWRI